ncbi:Anoctamin-7 [Lobulomyces angularis]|nr:Anoctamin-7 [Lobulomyces angularis]
MSNISDSNVQLKFHQEPEESANLLNSSRSTILDETMQAINDPNLFNNSSVNIPLTNFSINLNSNYFNPCHSNIIVNSLGDSTFIHFYKKKDASLFEKISNFKKNKQNSSLSDALDKFIDYNKADVFCQLLYKNDTLLPAAVIKFALNKLPENSEKNKKKILDISDFEAELLKLGLICVFELASEAIAEEEVWYIKIFAPFSTLADEAEKVHLKLPTILKKADTIKSRLKEKSVLIKKNKILKRNSSLVEFNENAEMQTSNSKSDTDSDPEIQEDSQKSSALRRRTLRQRMLSLVLNKNPPKAYLPTFVEGPDGTFIGSLKYMFCIITDPQIPHLANFRKDFIREFVGGNLDKKLVQLKFFSSSQKNFLTYGIINRCKIYSSKDDDDEVKIYGLEELLLKKTFVDFFALHSGPHKPLNESYRSKIFIEMNFHKRSLLNSKALLAFTPLKDVRYYFGEKIAFYFAWISFYTLWCWLAALIGLIVFFYGVYFNFTTVDTTFHNSYEMIFDNPLTAPYALFISLWALIFLEFWKRQEATLQVVWGITEMHKLKMYRPQWKGTDIRTSPITGLQEKYHPKRKRLTLKALSFLTLGVGILFIVFIQVLIIVYQALVKGERNGNKDLSKVYIASGLGAAFSLVNIIVFTPIYLRLATTLTDIENHKTEGGWENSFIAKEFVLNFVLTYTPLIFIGVIKVFIKDVWDSANPVYRSYLSELTIQMVIIFMGYQYFYQVVEILMAPLKNLIVKIWEYFSKTEEEKEMKKKKFIYYQDEKLQKYVQRYDFSTKIIQFGFLTLFSAAFPLAPFFALISNIFEIRLDTFKLLTQVQRPFALRQKDIGLWLDFLNFLALFGSICNSMVIAFNSKWFDTKVNTYFDPNYVTGAAMSESTSSKVLAFKFAFVIFFNYFVLIARWVINVLVPDCPEAIRNYIKHEAYCKKLESGEEADDS